MSIKSFGGVYVHPESHVKVEPYMEGYLFCESQKKDRSILFKNLIFILDHGRKANIRRHIASLMLPDGKSEKCILDTAIDGVSYSRAIGKSELLARSKGGREFYCDSSVIFSVAKYCYMPPSEFIAAVSDEVDRISCGGNS